MRKKDAMANVVGLEIFPLVVDDRSKLTAYASLGPADSYIFRA